MKSRKVFVNTIGCQMNVYDSEKIISSLVPLGFRQTGDLDDADLVVLNTCTIREKAEQKAFSFLGRLKKLKLKKPGLVIAVGGCVAQQEGSDLIKRVPFVDLVFGTRAIGRVDNHIRKIISSRCKIVDVEMTYEIVDSAERRVVDGSVTAFVTVMTGCENYCSYCVVPSVRGKEVSRRPEVVLSEISGLVDSGVKEVTLLGQNVNSYGLKQGFCSFAELISKVNELEGLSRIRFTTSHPKDLSRELMEAFQKNEKLCGHMHLPVQSGSNRILKKMNRGYSRESYLEKVRVLRQINSSIRVSTDIITGFPGETDEDFDNTLDLVRQAEFDSLFAFKYSDRPSAPSRKFRDKIPETVKMERLRRVLSLQHKQTLFTHRSLIGSIQMVLVEGFSKKQRSEQAESGKVEWTGRTTGNVVVNFSVDEAVDLGRDENLTGKLVGVKIEKAFPHSIWGKRVNTEPGFPGLKGDTYAA
jgi:tRNA-2-methylthio-N6-dimethylallyladenosine synthase